MKLIYKFDSLGGFLVGDEESGLTLYAYPSSHYANRAAIKPETTADMMMLEEIPYADLHSLHPDFDERNWKLLRSET